jgi:hypothetical protein
MSGIISAEGMRLQVAQGYDIIMSKINSTKPTASIFVNAVCVDVEDMGQMTTKFGTKPMVKFTFETDQTNEYGTNRRLTRLFHKHFHPLSALSTAARSWCQRDLEAEEENIGEVDLQTFIDMPATIRLEPGAMKDGKRYDNIAEILPLEKEEVKETCEPKENE